MWSRECKTSDFILIGNNHPVSGVKRLSTRKRQCVSAVHEEIFSLPGLLSSQFSFVSSLSSCLPTPVKSSRPSMVSKNDDVDELFDCQHRRRIIQCRMHAAKRCC